MEVFDQEMGMTRADMERDAWIHRAQQSLEVQANALDRMAAEMAKIAESLARVAIVLENQR